MALPVSSPGRHAALLGQDEALFESGRDVRYRFDEAPTEVRLDYAANGYGPNYGSIASTVEFLRLRRRLRRFVFPMSVLFMAWYLTFVLLAAYAHRMMSIQVLGLINVGMVLGLAQFVSTVVIMLVYCRYVGRKLDPTVERIRLRHGVRS